MRKLTLGALLSALVLAGCGGSSHSSTTSHRTGSPTVSTSAASNRATIPTGQSSPRTSTQSSASSSAATGSAGAATTPAPSNSASNPTTTTGSPSTGGVSPSGQGSGSVSTPSSAPTAEDYAKAQAALPGCQRNQPGVTQQQLAQEAASPEGIQC